MYYVVALSNPGRLIGDHAEVQMKSRAYNPDHYVIDETPSNDGDHPREYASSVYEHDQARNERKTALTGIQLSRHERPKTPTQLTL